MPKQADITARLKAAKKRVAKLRRQRPVPHKDLVMIEHYITWAREALEDVEIELTDKVERELSRLERPSRREK